MHPFHLAIPVHDLSLADKFYGDILGCSKGRTSAHWIDWNFWEHQLVTHLVSDLSNDSGGNDVDGKHIGVPHFGVVLDKKTWLQVKQQLESADIAYAVKPGIRFKDAPGEQGTFFARDYSNNLLEFKYFNDLTALFAV